MKTIIYRIQDGKGRGPFVHPTVAKWIEYRPDHDNLRAWPMEWPGLEKQIESERQKGEHYGSGCLSIDQLRRWFTRSEYKTLQRLGFKCVRMNTHAILAHGPTQCVFMRRQPLRKNYLLTRLY